MSASVTVVSGRPSFLDEFQISGQETSQELTVEYEDLPCSTTESVSRETAPGLPAYQLSHEGMINWSATGVETILNARAKAKSQVVWTQPTIKGLTGTIAYFGTAKLYEFNQDLTVPQFPTFTFLARQDVSTNIVRGTILAPVAARTTSSSGTAYQVGAASAAQRIYAAIHCTAFDGTSLDVIVESDNVSGMTSPATRLSFAQLTAVGKEFVSAAGPVTDDWWRATWTFVGTSATFIVTFGIE